MQKPKTSLSKSSWSFFTLIELLVVIAIIAILAGMLLPALNRVRKSALSTICIGNFKSVSLGIGMYADDNQDYLPCSQTNDYNKIDLLPQGLINQYVKNTKIFTECRYRTRPLPGLSKEQNYWYYKYLSCGGNLWIIYSDGVDADVASKYASPPHDMSQRKSFRRREIYKPSKKIMFGDSRSGSNYSDSPRQDFFGHRIHFGFSSSAVDYRHSNKAHILTVDGHFTTLKYELARDLNYYYYNFMPGKNSPKDI